MLEQSSDVDKVFYALGDPARRAMVDLLSRGPLSVSELAQPFTMTLAAVVQHVQVLEHSGVITTQKVGRVRTCKLAPRGLASAERWISERRNLWERKLDRLGDFLEAKHAGPRASQQQEVESSWAKQKGKKK